MEKGIAVCREVYHILEQSPEINITDYDDEQVMELNAAVIRAIELLEEVVTL